MAKDPAQAARDRLIAIEIKKQRAVFHNFERIRVRLSAQIDDLIFQVETLRKTQGNAPESLLFQKTRLTSILDDVKDEMDQAAVRLAILVAGAQSDAIDTARRQMAATDGIEGNLAFFDSDATKEIVGSAIEGGPLVKTFAAISKPMRTAMFDSLFFGMATGAPAAQIAKEVRAAIGGGTARAMTIVRTETNRAYREASRKFYEAEPNVAGWRWVAALDLRTCPICWSLHGHIFKTSTKFGTHPNCRCTMVPVFADDPAVETGPKKFNDLSEAQQKAILGPGRYDLYKQGAELSDFVGQVRTPFGIGRTVKPISATTFKPNPRGPGNAPLTPTKGGGVPIARPIPKPRPKPVPVPTPTEPVAKPFDPVALRTDFITAAHGRRPAGFAERGAALLAEKDRTVDVFLHRPLGLSDAERDAMKEAAEKALNEYRDHKAIDAAFRKQDREGLYHGGTGKSVPADTASLKSKPDRKLNVETVVGELDRLITPKAWADTRPVWFKNRTARAHYDVYARTVAANFDYATEQKVVAHEIGHAFECSNPDVLAAANEFLNYRTRGEGLVRLKKLYPNFSYGRNELTRADKFKDAYVGKQYGIVGKQDSTEVISMGLEYIYSDPLQFAIDEPEYFDFMTTVIRGEKWSTPK